MLKKIKELLKKLFIRKPVLTEQEKFNKFKDYLIDNKFVICDNEDSEYGSNIDKY